MSEFWTFLCIATNRRLCDDGTCSFVCFCLGGGLVPNLNPRRWSRMGNYIKLHKQQILRCLPTSILYFTKLIHSLFSSQEYWLPVAHTYSSFPSSLLTRVQARSLVSPLLPLTRACNQGLKSIGSLPLRGGPLQCNFISRDQRHNLNLLLQIKPGIDFA